MSDKIKLHHTEVVMNDTKKQGKRSDITEITLERDVYYDSEKQGEVSNKIKPTEKGELLHNTKDQERVCDKIKHTKREVWEVVNSSK